MLVGLQSCPHCQSENVATEWREVEEIMGKISKAQGATRFTPEPATYDAFTLEPVGEQDEVVDDGNSGGPRPDAPNQTGDTKLPAEVDYDKLTVAELQKLLKDRQLPDTGKQAELVARLKEHDAKAAEKPAEKVGETKPPSKTGDKG